MNGTFDLIEAFRTHPFQISTEKTAVLCPPFPLIHQAQECLGDIFKMGAQDCGDHLSGAFTGSVSPKLLKDIGVVYVLLGHSEKRAYAHETDELVLKKAVLSKSVGLIPVVCVGETLKEKEEGRTAEVITRQLCLLKEHFETSLYIIAYEPVWAIGTGHIPTLMDIEIVHQFIKDFLKPKDTQVLYGGSVTSTNAHHILGLGSVDGVLVGGASLDPKSLGDILG